MKIGIIPNSEKDIQLVVTKKLINFIKEFGGVALISEEFKPQLYDLNESDIQYADTGESDLLICLGGDGTFLKTVHNNFKLHIPIIGINLGNVGFLAEISVNSMHESLKRIFTNDFSSEKRMLIEAICYSSNGDIKGRSIALNDVVISRGGASRILNLDLKIDDFNVEKLPGDGIIISTPTGSTAYSLSAGGPIIQPDLETILITPLNPHTLHNRCYITGPDAIIEILVCEYPYNPLLTADGQLVCELEQNDKIIIRKSDSHFHLVKLDKNNFYDSLSEKIYFRTR